MSFETNSHSIDTIDEMTTHLSIDDSIGDTVFSKQWLFKCLIKALEQLNGESNNESQRQTQTNETLNDIELDPQLEEELCILWDMSANEEVILFLNHCKAIDLLETILQKTNSRRFAEISAGILANISVNQSICVTLANRQGFRELILRLLESSDTPFLIQLVRLISTSLSNFEVQSLWISSIKSNGNQFFTTIHYILENCLNCDLLKALFLLINKILYIDDSLSNQWLDFDQQNESSKCLLRASHQLISEDEENFEFLDYLWLILHSLSLSKEDFVATHLICCQNEILTLFEGYITNSFGDSVDYIISSAQRAGSLSATISICSQIISSSSIRSQLVNDSQLIDCIKHLIINCEQTIDQMSANSESFQMAFDQLKAILELFQIKNSEFNELEITQTR